MWIEYNGLQHYKKVDYFHKTDEGFLKQLNRDNEVRKYCKENNIILIEIPYTYNTYEKSRTIIKSSNFKWRGYKLYYRLFKII